MGRKSHDEPNERKIMILAGILVYLRKHINISETMDFWRKLIEIKLGRKQLGMQKSNLECCRELWYSCKTLSVYTSHYIARTTWAVGTVRPAHTGLPRHCLGTGDEETDLSCRVGSGSRGDYTLPSAGPGTQYLGNSRCWVTLCLPPAAATGSQGEEGNTRKGL